MHFCTPGKLQEIHNQDQFDSIRTGYIPQYYEGDIIKITHFITKDILCYAKVLSCKPVVYGHLNKDKHHEEIARYHRTFDSRQYFFIIQLRKMKEL